jgi:hypothetical protein
MAESFSSIPSSISCYRVPAAVLAETAKALRDLSAGWRESVVLWPGRVVTETEAVVTRLLVPEQSTGPLHFNVPLRERLRILGEVTKESEFVLIQLHTHPKQAFHSAADDALAITKHTGAVSIVIPDFGRLWTGELRTTSVNIHLGAGRWAELPPADVERLFQIEG